MVFLGECESVQVFLCVYICIVFGCWDYNNWFNSATLLCLSQSRTWITNPIYCVFFSVVWCKRWLFVLFKLVELLIITVLKLSFHNNNPTPLKEFSCHQKKKNNQAAIFNYSYFLFSSLFITYLFFILSIQTTQ